jgi:hypothetical protein
MIKLILWLRSFRILPLLVLVSIAASIITQSSIFALSAIALAILSTKD